MLGQLVVLYAPTAPGTGGVPGHDKAVHVAVFAAVAATALAAGARRRVVVGVFVAHAAVSELVQAGLLPGRSGDAWDVVADVAGVLLAVGVVEARRRTVLAPRRRADDDGAVTSERQP